MWGYFIGSIVPFVGDFAPRGWFFCNGGLLAIGEYQQLFAVIGNEYGGNGITNFALPDFRGRVAIHAGTGPGLSSYRIGQKGGAENVVINPNELPAHSHAAKSIVNVAEEGIVEDPSRNFIAGTGTSSFNSSANIALNSNSVSTKLEKTGGVKGHYNVPPFVTVNYIICNDGVFPQRS